MIEPIAVVVIGVVALGVVGLLLPVLDRLVDHQLGRDHDEGAPIRRPRVQFDVDTRFEPLDLGEDPMRWPSEHARDPYVERMTWPSTRWDDPSFGRPEAVQAAEAARRKAEDAAQRTARHATETPASREARLSSEASAAPPAPATTAARAVVKVKRRPEASANGRVSPAEVAELLDKHGFSDAIRILMQERGVPIKDLKKLVAAARAQGNG